MSTGIPAVFLYAR